MKESRAAQSSSKNNEDVRRINVPAIGTGHYSTPYDLSPDGRRIYFIDRQVAEAPREIEFVLGWRELLKKRRTR